MTYKGWTLYAPWKQKKSTMTVCSVVYTGVHLTREHLQVYKCVVAKEELLPTWGGGFVWTYSSPFQPTWMTRQLLEWIDLVLTQSMSAAMPRLQGIWTPVLLLVHHKLLSDHWSLSPWIQYLIYVSESNPFLYFLVFWILTDHKFKSI